MIKKLILFLVLLSFFSFGFSADYFECGIKPVSDCNPSTGVNLFYVNHNFMRDGKILSSNVALASDSNYNYGVCCEISNPDLGLLDVSYVNVSDACPDSDEDINTKEYDVMHFTGNINSRTGLPFIDNVKSSIDDSYFSEKVCVGLPKEFSTISIVATESGDMYRSFSGYKCLYRTNDLTNGLVSSCDASFNYGNQYKYTVWAKLQENDNSLQCNADCTSKLDNRVYTACGTKILTCSRVPDDCDGSLYGAWVNVNNDPNVQVQCSAPWTNTKENIFTDEKIVVDTVKNECSNLIKRKFPVTVDNELITMNIYVCGD